MTILRFKTLEQKTFELEVDPSITIAEVKQKIEAAHGHPVSAQKLIHSGKILPDDQKVESFKIGEKDFVVLMVAKQRKPAAQPKAVDTKAEAPATPATPSVPPAPAPTPAIAVPSAPAGDTSLATGSLYEEAVQNLVAMGFELAQVKTAMRAAFNNPDRAAEYLMTGIPPHLLREMQPAAQPATPQQPQTTGAPPATPGNLFDAAQRAATTAPNPTQSAESPASGNPLAFLSDSSQMAEMRHLVQTNPQLLQPLIQQLASTNPELMQLLNENPDAVMNLLETLASGEPMEGLEGEEGGEEGVQYIQITPQEEEAINRLVALGFDRALAVEAYFACDKNEELAANYLFDLQGGQWQ